MHIYLDYHSRTPIYTQIKEQIVLAIHNGDLQANEQLPSLRTLSADLGVNINTIKRALSELESQGITYSVAGKGIFVSPKAASNSFYLQQALEKATEALSDAKAMGADYEQLLATLNHLYKGDGER